MSAFCCALSCATAPPSGCTALYTQQRAAPPRQHPQRQWQTGGGGGGAPDRRRGGGRPLLPPVAAIRAVESFGDGTFELEQQQRDDLHELLFAELFYQQVVRDCKLPEGSKVEFTGVLFQPRPWTPTETKGMPLEIEQKYYSKPEQYQIINVPPVFMFKAKIFQPPRLCAVYKRL